MISRPPTFSQHRYCSNAAPPKPRWRPDTGAGAHPWNVVKDDDAAQREPGAKTRVQAQVRRLRAGEAQKWSATIASAAGVDRAGTECNKQTATHPAAGYACASKPQQTSSQSNKEQRTSSRYARPAWCAMRWKATCSLAPAAPSCTPGPGTRSSVRRWLQ